MTPELPQNFFVPISRAHVAHMIYCHETNLLKANADEAVGYVTEYDDLVAVWGFEKKPDSNAMLVWDASAAVANSWWNKNRDEYAINPDRPVPAFITQHCEYDLTDKGTP